jgi:hypothetical protein
MWNLILVRLETVLVSVQDRCTVLLDAHSGQFGNNANLDARLVNGWC